MTEHRRKLIEVALPVEAISAACRRDKDRSVGTIKNVHKWFAPMPAPAWRALLFAALVDDPGDPHGRTALLRLIERLVPDHGGPPPDEALREARRILQSNQILPVVFDPFCGGGSTVVEAQRLGLPAVASDLNPIPVLITRTLAQLIPQVASRLPLHSDRRLEGISAGSLEGLVTDLRYYAERVRDDAWKTVGHLYPSMPGGTIVAWLWARTVMCPNPACRAIIPLYTSAWLSKKKGQERWLKPVVTASGVTFEIGEGAGPPPPATKASPRGAKFRCLACSEIAPEAYVKKEGRAGRLGLQLLTTVLDAPGGRTYLPADERQACATTIDRPDDVPELKLPNYTRWFSSPAFGMTTQADLYTARQLHMLGAFSDAVARVPAWVAEDGGDEVYGCTIATILGLCVGKLAQGNSTQVRWYTREGPSRAMMTFATHALPMVWDFAEANPVGGSVGDWLLQLESLMGALRTLPGQAEPAITAQHDARTAGELVGARSALVATDPPYFAQIGYADLADYFYVWERRALRQIHPDLFATIATPKDTELVATPYRQHGNLDPRSYFVDGFTAAFKSLASASLSDLPMVVIYAHRQEETQAEGLTSTAWDAILEALLAAGFAIVGTWPVEATRSTRQIGQGTNALASYIAMVCRPRIVEAGITDRLGFLRALRAELPAALRALQEAAIPPLDLTQAAIGPGMAVFSRYARVVGSDGEAMSVRAALGLINQMRSEVLSEQEDEFDRDTRWAIQWFEEYAFDEGPFGRAEVLFTATDTSLEGLRRAGIVGSRPPKVWLLPPEELRVDWDPSADTRIPVWEVTMHLLKRLDTDGEAAAADLLARVGGLGDTARDLAYRLADICERKARAKLALAFNALIVSWPEIARQAAAAGANYQQDTLL